MNIMSRKVASFICVVATLLWAMTFLFDFFSDDYEIPPGLTGVMAGMASTAAAYIFRVRSPKGNDE